MGNRAHVVFQWDNITSPAIYMHWNGGPESVYPMLDALAGFGIPSVDYGAARFTQIVGNYFGGNLSLGIAPCGVDLEDLEDLSQIDQGLYLVFDATEAVCKVKRCIYGEWLSEEAAAKERADALLHPYNTSSEETITQAITRTSGAFFRAEPGYRVVASIDPLEEKPA